MTPGAHCSKRLFEWVATGIMLSIGVMLVLSPGSIANGVFHLLMLSGITQHEVEFILILFGATRVVALFANGMLPVYGPLMRAGCAFAGAFVWFQFMYALAATAPTLGYVTPGVPVYFFLVVGEVMSCYRAAVDGNRSNQRPH